MISIIKTLALFLLTAVFEIFGCYAAWLWLREGGSAWWILPGLLALALFAGLLTLQPVDAAGRVYAAYGGVYVVSALAWLWTVEQRIPDRWDVAGSIFCLIGMGIIVFGPRG